MTGARINRLPGPRRHPWSHHLAANLSPELLRLPTEVLIMDLMEVSLCGRTTAAVAIGIAKKAAKAASRA